MTLCCSTPPHKTPWDMSSTLANSEKHFVACLCSSASPQRSPTISRRTGCPSLFCPKAFSGPRVFTTDSVLNRSEVRGAATLHQCGVGGREIPQLPCLFGGHTVSPRVLKGTEPRCSSGNTLISTSFIGFPPFPGSIHSHWAFWDHLPNKFLAPKSLSHDPLLGGTPIMA